ncbi:LysR family transcriptional regulator [Saccharothrix variisporea]|uniref:DNA-binding transcriptional LysR family regulator n=1 Tax=Saccharothrix variisporea TaxID=543527 RepID=A0A495XLM3_9PSEU|nr:LysR family transcriptional regulator [Saccharothrix variisporea]RKT73363.1 DNA-binding transcriptional LysR family regulator [Saccharothrix variisporea]
MELRDIEIFLTLAEELHFGRAAARLHVSQARISQAVKTQERRLGGELFDRSNRRQVRLTPLGRQLRDDLRPVYEGLRDSLERARLAARGITAVLRVGLLPINTLDLRPYWDTFHARHPAWKLHLGHPSFTDLFGSLRRGEIDVLVGWLPVEEPDLTVGPTLFTDQRVLAVAAHHELAGRTAVTVDVLADFPHTDFESRPDYWADSFVPSDLCHEQRLLVRNSEEVLTLAGMGEAVVLFPEHMAHYAVRPDIAYLPVRNAKPLTYALIWRTESENDIIRALAAVVQDLGPHLAGR